jgi:NAD(P)-dependent dehydrogenase (short-subunit alcohol dehydrogenase family)
MTDKRKRPVAVVTGAAGGIGRATVQVLAEAGWSVVAVDRRGEAAFPERVEFIQADIAQPEAVETLFATLGAKLEGLQALVNNAAIQIIKPLVATSVEEWDAVMDANLRSIFLTARHAHPLLVAGRGAIVNVSSVHALATSTDIAAYAASKGGIMALTRAMALEFGRQGIRVNAILPGAVDTPMLRAGLAREHVSGASIEERMHSLGSKTVLGRVGRPEEIGKAILFLCDPDLSSFVTGQSLVVDGGATARLSTE